MLFITCCLFSFLMLLEFKKWNCLYESYISWVCILDCLGEQYSTVCDYILQYNWNELFLVFFRYTNIIHVFTHVCTCSYMYIYILTVIYQHTSQIVWLTKSDVSRLGELVFLLARFTGLLSVCVCNDYIQHFIGCYKQYSRY